MIIKALLAVIASLILAVSVSADGLYTKNSAVLQVDSKNYHKLIAKSNYVSIVEFYAPWCGHCKNLKPEYEKAAKNLKELAQVAAVNCDDESNKAFCGSMGVQGFPTLKIVKPSKKPGKPVVEDYQGARSASGIIDAVKSAIPNNVKKVTDKSLSAFLDSNNDTSKAILFTEKGTTSALIKVLAIDYVGNVNFAQIRDKETTAADTFGVTEYPTLVVLPGGTREPVKFEGEYKKSSMKDFLSEYVRSKGSDQQQEPLGKKQERTSDEKATNSEQASSSFSKASASHAAAEASEEAAGATSITLEPESDPTESPGPIPSPDAPKPVEISKQAEPIPALIEQKYLQERCLGAKTSTCILALLPTVAEEESLPEAAASALSSLAELSEKHAKRETKLFPFYSIPIRNAASLTLRDALKLEDQKVFELIAVNARRGWYRRYSGEKFDFQSIEDWIDNIRFGEGSKEDLPESLLMQNSQKAAAPDHGEL